MSPAYIAGFFDGEGSIGIYVRRGSEGRLLLLPSVSATQSEPHHQVLLDIRRIYGGGLYPKINYDQQSSQRWDWRLSSADKVRAFLTDILPYLRIKYDRAQLMLETLDLASKVTDKSVLTAAYKEASERCSAMNLRGPPSESDPKKRGARAPLFIVPDD